MIHTKQRPVKPNDVHWCKLTSDWLICETIYKMAAPSTKQKLLSLIEDVEIVTKLALFFNFLFNIYEYVCIVNLCYIIWRMCSIILSS